MQRSEKVDMHPNGDVKPAVLEMGTVERSLAVEEIVNHVVKMVAEHGNGEEFNSREWVNRWLDLHVPALGGKPRGYLGTAEGRALVKNVLDMSWSGAYA